MKVPAAFEIGTASHTGHVRVNNEDDYLLGAREPRDGELLLCAVADGMGGAAGGAEASRTALRALGSTVLGGDAQGPIDVCLAEGFRQASTWVHEQAMAIPALHGMGTTLTAACLLPGRVAIGHVGDTRLYRLRGRAIEQLTEDHALRQPENVLLRCIGGGQAECQPDFSMLETEPGDRFLLLSDGVWGFVGAAELAELGRRDGPQAAAEALVGAALAAGGQDNATAVVVDVLATEPSNRVRELDLQRGERPGPRDGWPRPRSLRPPAWPWIALLIAAVLTVIAGLRWWAGVDVLAWLLQKW